MVGAALQPFKVTTQCLLVLQYVEMVWLQVMRLAMMEMIQMDMDVFSLLILMLAEASLQDGVVQEVTRHLQQYVPQFVETVSQLEMKRVMMEMTLMVKDAFSHQIQMHVEEQ